MVLQRRGYRVRATANPKTALAWFAAGERPDLLLTDVRMAEMNGTVFARAALAHFPALKIILMSGDAAPELAAQEQIQGATFEQKPVSPPALLRAVRARLDEV
jgi:DNA-binding NtrC family response regulator